MTSCWSATTRCARRSASSRCAHTWSPSLPAPWRRRRCCRDASRCPPARGSAWCSPAATSIPTSSATSCAAVEGARCDGPGDARPLVLLYEHAAVPQRGQYSVIALLTALSEGTANEVGRRMAGGANALVERFKPTRLVVARVVDRLRLLVMLDAGQAIDIDRYLASSLRRQHMDALAPYLSAPPQWYALDPVWRYFRDD